ncbi:hypothetical protein V6N13_068802 [Hibiscus sabdariffa]
MSNFFGSDPYALVPKVFPPVLMCNNNNTIQEFHDRRRRRVRKPTTWIAGSTDEPFLDETTRDINVNPTSGQHGCTAVNFVFVVTNALFKMILNQGTSRVIILVYRQTISTLCLTPIAYVRESFPSCVDVQ